MAIVPTEILVQIFSYLCFHCQNPGLFPHTNTNDVRESKKCLAYLCRASKAFCAIAQPILYHYYASGNILIETKLDNYEEHSRTWIKERDYLPQFLRTLSRRPELALHVVTMQLTQGTECRSWGLPKNPDQLAALEKLMKNGLQELLNELRSSHNLGSSEEAPHQVPRWPKYFDTCPENWLVEVALVLTPRLQSLLLAIDHVAYIGPFTPHFKFPCLRTLGLMSYQFDYGFGELAKLYAAAPNLEVIYAENAHGWSMSSMGDRLWGLELGNLRKLAIVDVLPSSLECLLTSVPKLEELEYFWDGWYENDNYDTECWLDWELEPVTQTLKRLYLSFMPRNYPQHAGHPAAIQNTQYSRFNYFLIRDLRDFVRLEELMLDCRSIYLDGVDNPDRLISLLPSSIQSLRITYVFMGMERSLARLALEAPEKFPHLKRLDVGFAESPNPDWKIDIEQTMAVDGLFAAAGIELVWGKDRVEPHGRTIIPGAMIWSRLFPLPMFDSSLDRSDVRFD